MKLTPIPWIGIAVHQVHVNCCASSTCTDCERRDCAVGKKDPASPSAGRSGRRWRSNQVEKEGAWISDRLRERPNSVFFGVTTESPRLILVLARLAPLRGPDASDATACSGQGRGEACRGGARWSRWSFLPCGTLKFCCSPTFCFFCFLFNVPMYSQAPLHQVQMPSLFGPLLQP